MPFSLQRLSFSQGFFSRRELGGGNAAIVLLPTWQAALEHRGNCKACCRHSIPFEYFVCSVLMMLLLGSAILQHPKLSPWINCSSQNWHQWFLGVFEHQSVPVGFLFLVSIWGFCLQTHSLDFVDWCYIYIFILWSSVLLVLAMQYNKLGIFVCFISILSFNFGLSGCWIVTQCPTGYG